MSTVTGGAPKLLYIGSSLTQQAAYEGKAVSLLVVFVISALLQTAAAASDSVPRFEPEHGNVPVSL